MNIVCISGSLRTKSLNAALMRESIALAPEGVSMEIGRIDDFPLFNQDLEEHSYPPSATRLKEQMRAADGILFFTPEFNRSIPSPLKNALDWSSRPSGTHPFGSKPVGVLGVSSGPRGTIVAQYDVKRMMNYFGAHVMGNPEFYVDNSDRKFDESGTLTHEKTKEYLLRYIHAFVQHVQKLS